MRAKKVLKLGHLMKLKFCKIFYVQICKLCVGVGAYLLDSAGRSVTGCGDELHSTYTLNTLPHIITFCTIQQGCIRFRFQAIFGAKF